jgi:hypothetical protein
MAGRPPKVAGAPAFAARDGCALAMPGLHGRRPSRSVMDVAPWRKFAVMAVPRLVPGIGIRHQSQIAAPLVADGWVCQAMAVRALSNAGSVIM